MTNTLEKQYVVSRRKEGEPMAPMLPWKWFDGRAEARAFCKAKVAKSKKWSYIIDAVTRGPRS